MAQNAREPREEWCVTADLLPRHSLEGRSRVQLAESDSGPPPGPSLGFRTLSSQGDFANRRNGYGIPEPPASRPANLA
jgi:hypothetical protein